MHRELAYCVESGGSVLVQDLLRRDVERKGPAPPRTLPLFLFFDPSGSWGVSEMAGELRKLCSLVHEARLDPAMWVSLHATAAAAEPWSEPEPRRAPAAAPSALARDLRTSLVAEPVEAGVTHGGERFIEAAFREGQEPQLVACLRNLEGALRADALRLIARHRPPEVHARWADVVAEALDSREVDIRDAAAQLVEYWEDPKLAAILKDHDERTPWLADYIKDVLAELGA